MDSATGDSLAFKPPYIVCYKLLPLVCLCALISFGCGSNAQLPPDASLRAKSFATAIDSTRNEFSIAYVMSMDEAVDVPLEKIRRNLEREAVLEEDSPLGTCHEEELVGLASCMPEPGLYEDPLNEADCADNANLWCHPSHEKEYLSYLKHQEFLSAQADIQAAATIVPEFISPVENGLVLRGMQPSTKKRRRGHYGIDVIPSQWERHGVPLKAVEDGTVVISSWGRGYGYYVVVYHKNGLFSLYSHALKKSRAKVGQELNRGDTLAYMGKSGNARGYHVHFELIDLRESWDFEGSVDDFVQDVAAGRPLSDCTCEQFKQLLFAKKTKQDPLLYIAGLSLAKREKGKWVAGEKIIPSATANLAKTD